MANLKNCIITFHTSQEHEMDSIGGPFGADDVVSQLNWEFTNPGGFWLQDSGIANMAPLDPSIGIDTGFDVGTPLSDTYGNFSGVSSISAECLGGCSNIIMTIEPNNTTENLEGKDYQYVVAAKSFQCHDVNVSSLGNSNINFDTCTAIYQPALNLDPVYAPQNNVDYVVSYGSEDSTDVKRTQTGCFFRWQLKRYKVELQDPDYDWTGQVGEQEYVEDISVNYTPEKPDTNMYILEKFQDVRYITFHDTGIPNTPGNKVIVKVYLRPGFVMPDEAYTVNLNINMDAVPYKTPHPNKLKWILTNQIWPNFNSWKLLTGVRVQDKYRYQYWDETVAAPVNFQWSATDQYPSDIEDIQDPNYFEGNWFTNGVSQPTFNLDFPTTSLYYESIGYWPENYYANITWLGNPIYPFEWWWDYAGADSDQTPPDSYSGLYGVAMAGNMGYKPTLGALKWQIDEASKMSSVDGSGYGFFAEHSINYLGNDYKSGDDGGWTADGYSNWLTHEFIGKQNPRAIKNCTIKHVNGNPTYDYSIDQYTWQKDIYSNQTISDVIGSDEIIEYKITPDEGYTLSAFDVCILPKMHLEYNNTTNVYELPSDITQDPVYGGYINIQDSEKHRWWWSPGGGTLDMTSYAFNNVYSPVSIMNWQDLELDYALDSDNEDQEKVITRMSYNRLYIKNYKYLRDHFKHFLDATNSSSIIGEYFIDVKWEDGTTLPYDTGTQMYADTLDKIMFGSDASILELTEDDISNFLTNGDALPQDIAQFEPNQYFNKKFESWKFGYPLVFEPFKIVNLGREPYPGEWIDTSGNPIPKPRGFEIGDANDRNYGRDGYPGGARSFAGYNDNSGIQYVEIKNTIPHSFQENPSPDNEVLVRIKIKSDWAPEESLLSSDQIYMLNIWGQARLENEELEFNVGPNQ